MNAIEIFLVFLTTVCAAGVIADRLKLPSPILLILSGLALGFVPALHNFNIPPDRMLLIFLPLLLTESAFFTSFRDFKANLRPILQLAIGLVIFTSITTAVLFHALIPGSDWAVGMVLGAIISPPDAVAATAIARQITMPRRIQTILEGESLINDATGLVLYKFAVAAVFTGAFHVSQVSMDFGWKVLSGPALGAAAGYLYMRLFPYIREQSVQILSTFILPFIVYIGAEALHSSSVLAVVASGLTIGWQAPTHFRAPGFRLAAGSVWRMTAFVLNGLVFLLIGLHMPALYQSLEVYSPWQLAYWVAAISLSAALTRILWVFLIGYGTRWLFPWIRRKDPYPPWQNIFIIAWTGMRGMVTLATALALPIMDADGTFFPDRELIIFLACGVILVTVVLQGLSLPWLLRKLDVTYEWTVLHETWLARKNAAQAAMDKLQTLHSDGSIQSAALERITGHYRDRLESLGDGPNTPLRGLEPPSSRNHPLIQTENVLWRTVLDIEEKVVVDLRRKFEISDDVMNDILRDIDLMKTRFEPDFQI